MVVMVVFNVELFVFFRDCGCFESRRYRFIMAFFCVRIGVLKSFIKSKGVVLDLNLRVFFDFFLWLSWIFNI